MPPTMRAFVLYLLLATATSVTAFLSDVRAPRLQRTTTGDAFPAHAGLRVFRPMLQVFPPFEGLVVLWTIWSLRTIGGWRECFDAQLYNSVHENCTDGPRAGWTRGKNGKQAKATV